MQQSNLTESPSVSKSTHRSWCLKVIYAKNLDFVLVIIKVTFRHNHWGSLRVSCQTSALQKSIFSSPSEPRRPLIRWRNMDNQPSSSAPRLHTPSVRCTCWASSRVWLLQGSKTHGKKKNPRVFHLKTPTANSSAYDKTTHRAWRAVVHLPDLVEDNILDEHSDGLQDEWHKQMHVDVVPRAVELPRWQRGKRHTHTQFNKDGLHTDYPMSLELIA